MHFPFLGSAFVILSMFFFSLLYAIFKACTPFISNTQIIFLQSLFSWIFLAPFLLKKGRAFLKTALLGRIVLRTLFGLVSMICITFAVKTTSLAEVVVLNNTAPLFVPLIVWVWHREKIPLFLLLSMCIGFLGVLIIFRPGFESVHLGVLLAALSGLFSGLLFVVTKYIAHEPFLRILFYYYLIWWVVTLPFAFFSWEAIPSSVWALLVAAAIASLLAQGSVTASLRYASSQELAPFIYTSVIFSAFLGWLIWGELIDITSLIGMGFIIIGGIATLLNHRKRRV
jgi:drug/metabolite transporter (DMT)-like permease